MEFQKTFSYVCSQSWSHCLVLFVSEYFRILYLGVLQRDLFHSAEQSGEGRIGNLSQNFIMIVCLLCSHWGFPVQEQCSIRQEVELSYLLLNEYLKYCVQHFQMKKKRAQNVIIITSWMYLHANAYTQMVPILSEKKALTHSCCYLSCEGSCVNCCLFSYWYAKHSVYNSEHCGQQWK